MQSVNNKSQNKNNRTKTSKNILKNYEFRTSLQQNLPNQSNNNSNQFLSNINEFFLFEFILFQYIFEL